MEISAPAKINLTLTVKGRRDDGFHEIDSLVCPTSLADTLILTARDSRDLEFVCSDPTLPTGESNLVVRAARLFCRHCQREPRLRIELQKRIPHGAGLGGGSSDAAATLLALDQLFETRLGLEALTAMAAELGSDVPLFLHRSAVRITGRGEHVEPVAFPHALPLLLIKPEFGVPTPWAFRQWKDSREISGIRYTPQELPWGTLHNDLERPVFEKYLFLAVLKRWLLAQPEVAGALMSGSGATVFAVLYEESSVPHLRDRLHGEFGAGLWSAFVRTSAGGVGEPASAS